MKKRNSNITNSNEINVLILLFFVVAFAEVIAELFSYLSFIYLLKSLLSPLLIAIYWISSKKRNNYFILALLFVLVANIFFVSKEFNSILIGSIFFMFYRIIIIYLVIKAVRVKSYLPVFLGSVPFIIAFLYITSLTIDELGDGLYIYIMQVLFISFLGGFSLANYIIDNNKMNFWLLISCMLFTLIQLIFILKMFYISVFIFQPIAMVFYTFAQFSLYKFMILSEELDDDFLPA